MRQDHYPIGFEDFVYRLAKDTPYVMQCRSLPYDKQAAIRHGHFYTRSEDTEVIIGEYVDKNKFGARFRINTTATTERERHAVIQDLYTRYGKR